MLSEVPQAPIIYMLAVSTDRFLGPCSLYHQHRRKGVFDGDYTQIQTPGFADDSKPQVVKDK